MDESVLLLQRQYDDTKLKAETEKETFLKTRSERLAPVPTVDEKQLINNQKYDAIDQSSLLSRDRWSYLNGSVDKIFKSNVDTTIQAKDVENESQSNQKDEENVKEINTIQSHSQDIGEISVLQAANETSEGHEVKLASPIERAEKSSSPESDDKLDLFTILQSKEEWTKKIPDSIKSYLEENCTVNACRLCGYSSDNKPHNYNSPKHKRRIKWFVKTMTKYHHLKNKSSDAVNKLIEEICTDQRQGVERTFLERFRIKSLTMNNTRMGTRINHLKGAEANLCTFSLLYTSKCIQICLRTL